MKLVECVLLIGVTAVTAMAQESSLPELTLDEAIQKALASNSALKTAGLETLRATDDLAANKTRRFAKTEVTALGGQLLTKPSVTFPAGSLGLYGSIGPIPSTDKTISIARKPVGAVFATVAQPLSSLYRIN
ncbi:MAG: TolC family protein, partial [Acidobacteriaceae bacterium]|nr:TolC family protein [Acidobacteriaceae bacterium]